MKKFLASIALALTALSNAYAENRLFPTDILQQGEVDAQITVGHESQSSNINFRGNTGTTSSKSDMETLQVRYGLGSSLHVGLAAPYASKSATETDYNSPAMHFSNNSGKGQQNLTLWITYGLLNDSASPYSLNVELLVTPDTAGTVKTAYTGRVTGGWKASNTLRLYSSLSASTSEDSGIANAYRFSVGAYEALYESVTLIPHLTYVRFEGTNAMSAMDQYAAGLSANIRLTPNTYLVPDVALFRNSAANSSDGFFHRDSNNNGKLFQLGLYHLF